MFSILGRLTRILLLAATAVGFTLFAVGNAQAAGQLVPKDGSLKPLQIRSQDVDVTIDGGYAVTTVDQVFHNPHNQDLAATYTFPVPRGGSVGEFVIWIDGKPVVGEVLPKEKARKVYQQEKAAGRQAGITEQDGHKSFNVEVARVSAGQDTRIRLRYFQVAAVDTGVGRYVYPLEDGGVDEQRKAFWSEKTTVQEHFGFHLRLRSGYPVDAVRVPDRGDAKVRQLSDREWAVMIDHGAAGGADTDGRDSTRPQAGAAQVSGQALKQQYEAAQSAANGATAATAPGVYQLDKDIVVYWRQQPGLPGSVDLVTYKPDAAKAGTFMLTVTPGDDLGPITGGQDWTFVLDISGSMASKLPSLAEGVLRALGKLRPEDRYRIVLFNDRARELTAGYLDATRANVQQTLNQVKSLRANGGTNLYQGLQTGLNGIGADRPTGIVLVTDGVANVGHTARKDFLGLLRGHDVRLFTFIMGNSANRPLLENLARVSGGFALNVSNSDDIVGRVLQAVGKVTHQALHDVQLKVDGIQVEAVTPEHPASLYRGQQLVLLGHYRGHGPAQVTLTGKISGQPVTYRTRFDFPARSKLNPELERLWAYGTIRDLRDRMKLVGKGADSKQAIVDLATQYGLVTPYTSMVVLEEQQFQHYGIKRDNRDRVRREEAARQQRAQQAPTSHRVDTAQPMFHTSRPSGGGGGALGGGSLIGLLGLVGVARLLRRKRSAR